MKTRPAEVDDIPAIMRWAAIRHEGSAYRHAPFSPTRTAENTVRLITRPEGLMLLAERDGQPVGAIAAELVDSAFIDGRIAVLWSLYVDGVKSGAAGLTLLRRYVDWAREGGAVLIEANNSASMNDESFVKLLSRVGFERSGSHMHRRL